MKKFYLLAVLCFSYTAFLLAQSDIKLVCVFLKDGNVLTAQLVKHTATEGLQLLIADSVSITLPYAVVDHIDIGSCKAYEKVQAKAERHKMLLTSGWYDVVLLSGLLGEDDSESTQIGLSLQYSKGYQWNAHFAAGAGVSVDMYDQLFVSLLLETQGKLSSKGSTPYYSLKGGYTIPTNSSSNGGVEIPTKGGLLLHPALGLQFPGRKNSNFCLEAGFRWQKYQREPNIWGFTDVVDKITYRRMTVSFGWRF